MDTRTKVGPRLDRRLLLAGAAATAAFAVVLVSSSLADRQHSVVRDPLSFFGSAEAPAPASFAVALLALAAIISWVGYRGLPDLVAVGVLATGLCSIPLALFPIDCSPVDEVCEVVVRAGADSASHDLHGYVGGVFHLVVAATAAVAARRRPLGVSPLAVFAAAVLFLVALVPIVLLIARPFGAGLGAGQLAGFGSAGVLVVAHLRRGSGGE